jgi:hypothetical protein
MVTKLSILQRGGGGGILPENAVVGGRLRFLLLSNFFKTYRHWIMSVTVFKIEI